MQPPVPFPQHKCESPMPLEHLKAAIAEQVSPLSLMLAGIGLKHIVTPRWSWRELLLAGLTGAAFTLWLAPGITAWFDLGDRFYGALCFLFGMFGLNFARGTLKLAQAWANDPHRILGPRKGDDDSKK